MGASEAKERRWSYGPALTGGPIPASAVVNKGAFIGVWGAHNYPLRVGQHIVCIDGWSGDTPEPPTLPPAPKGGQKQRKDERMRKEKMFAMRMSQQDYDRIQHKAGQAGMSMTGFLTASALDKKIVVVDGVDKVLGELKAIGRNLNQVTTLCNMGKITCLDLAEIKKGFGTVFDTLYDLMDRG